MNEELKTFLERIWNGEEAALTDLQQKYYLDEKLTSLLSKVLKEKDKEKVKEEFNQLTEELFLNTLLNGIIYGAAGAFDVLYQRYKFLVDSIINLKVSSLTSEEIKDLNQDVFLKIWNTITKNKNFGSFERLKRYIMKIAVNTAVDITRKPYWKRELQIIDEEDGGIEFSIDPGLSPEEQLLAKERWQLINKGMKNLKLSDMEKNTISQLFKEELSSQEIADDENVSVQAIYQRKHSILNKFKNFLKNLCFLLSFLI